MEKDNYLQNELFKVKADISKFDDVINRLNNASDKMSAVATEITKLIAVLETRMDAQEQFLKELSIKIESRRDIDEANYRSLNDKISNMRIEFRTDLVNAKNQVEFDIKKDLSERRLALNTEIDGLKKKISTLEKWQWVASGFAAAAGFAVSKLASYLKLLQ